MSSVSHFLLGRGIVVLMIPNFKFANAVRSLENSEHGDRKTEHDAQSEEDDSYAPRANATFTPTLTLINVEVTSPSKNGHSGTGHLIGGQGVVGKTTHGRLRFLSPDYLATNQIFVSYSRGKLQIDFKDDRGYCTGILEGDFSGSLGNLPKTGQFAFTQ